ncbi:putative cytoplasmic protein [Salmonella enterica subsp. enterica]|nr:putative cytoplasmic protein [Salmonella enterica subsp. enterica]
MPTYKQVVNHVKKHVLWKEEYFERYYQLNDKLVQKRLDEIYQAEDDLGVLIGTQLFCHFQANGTLYFDGCYKTGKADNSLLCTNLALWSIELACDHFDIREERGYTTKFSQQGESWLTLFACMVAHAKWSELTITFQQPAAMAWRNAGHLSSLTGT